MHAEEQYAANAIRVNEHIVFPKGFPHTQATLVARFGSSAIVPVDTSQFAKVDGGLSCLSVRFKLPSIN